MCLPTNYLKEKPFFTQNRNQSIICSGALMIAQTSAVNMDAECGNLMEITISDEKTPTSHKISVP